MSLLCPNNSRFQCYTSLHCDEYGYLRTWYIYNTVQSLYMDQSRVVDILLQLENGQQIFIPLIWWRHHYRWRASNFDLYSALMALEHLLWHGLTLYNGDLDLRRPVTLTPVAEHLAVKLSLPVFKRLGFVLTEDRTPISHTRGERSTTWKFFIKKTEITLSKLPLHTIKSLLFYWIH